MRGAEHALGARHGRERERQEREKKCLPLLARISPFARVSLFARLALRALLAFAYIRLIH